MRNLPAIIKSTSKEYSAEFIKETIFTLFNMNKVQLKALMEDENTPCLHLALGSVLARSITEADTTKLGFLLDRSVGKVKEVKEQEIPIDVRYVTEVNADGSLIQSVIKLEGPTDERYETFDIEALNGDSAANGKHNTP